MIVLSGVEGWERVGSWTWARSRLHPSGLSGHRRRPSARSGGELEHGEPGDIHRGSEEVEVGADLGCRAPGHAGRRGGVA